jgi:hypothetical protein
LKFYRIDWPAAEHAETCTDWSTSWDEAHKIGRARSDYYKVTQIELPDRKGEMLNFLKANIRGGSARHVNASEAPVRSSSADTSPQL